MLEEEQMKSIRTLSHTFSEAMARDVGLISKIYNATSRQDLKIALSEVLFRLYKRTLKKDTRSISPDKYQSLLEKIDSDEWREIQSLLVSFISIYAINQLNRKKENED